MKAPVNKKSSMPKKPVVKAKAAPVKKAAAKPVPKTSAKPAPKPASKAATKPVAKKAGVKTGTKTVVKATVGKTAAQPAKSAKPVVKTAAKPAKPAAKAIKSSPSVKSVSKASAKPVAKKPLAPAKSSKAVAKAPAKTSPKVTAKVSLKAPEKASAKVTANVPAKVPAKAPAKTTLNKAPAPTAKAAAESAKPSAKLATVPALSKPGVPLAPSMVITKPRTSKSGFVSPGNIAPKSMEVSTAAKTNFTMSTPALAPPHQVVVKKDAKLANNWKTKTAVQLTDAEAIAMPDSEYMSALQLAFFRLKLVQLKKEILSNAGETTEHLREDTSVVPDPADRATIEEEHALELRTRDRERKLLKKIEQSIARIDSEDYGYCDETGEAIGVARLIARPTANLSLEAQQRRELKQKMFGD
jgi:DnaK suppressor protein